PDPTPEPVHVISGSESNNLGLYGSYAAASAAANAELDRADTPYDHFTIVTVYYSDGSQKFALTMSSQW
ncbi:hypothetical protein, partial [Latilactobacillus graminis]|uniref:hypothetical protein n=1 Tax=Latilactobacillus graminis TaxID=60519 RepID=UPI000B28AA9E